MSNSTKVFLVPGFFGFSSLGAMNYFEGVAPMLEKMLSRRGVEADIVNCATLPTGSIRYRADRLLQQVVDAGGLEADELHFVGHSTGGLDIRLMLTPDVQLRDGDEEARVAERAVSAVSLATPHYGTPLATFFTSMQGRNLLRFLTVMATSDRGRYSIFAAAQFTRMIARLDDRLGRRNTMLDMVAEQLLNRLSLSKEDPFWRFLEDIESDQGAIVQLTPEGTNLFNAAVTNAPNTRYGSIMTVAAEPSWSTMTRIPTVDHAARYSVFSLMHRLTRKNHRQYPYPTFSAEQLRLVRSSLDADITPLSNDGVVPSMSQLHGELLAVFSADHLDVVGQFYQADIKPYADWLPSGSGFTQDRFEQVWSTVSDYVSEGRNRRGSASA